jgi:hypothetical protein
MKHSIDQNGECICGQMAVCPHDLHPDGDLAKLLQSQRRRIKGQRIALRQREIQAKRLEVRQSQLYNQRALVNEIEAVRALLDTATTALRRIHNAELVSASGPCWMSETARKALADMQIDTMQLHSDSWNTQQNP